MIAHRWSEILYVSCKIKTSSTTEWDLSVSFYFYNVPTPWGFRAKSERISTFTYV